MNVEFPEKLERLFKPARYKVLFGGRGAAKSWSIARALVLLAAQKPLRILCAREIQKSIDESVHQLLRDQIDALGLSSFFDVFRTEIRGKNGSQFIFAGLKHNVDNIKSKEGIDIVWVEEAQTVSKASWEKLTPTIRKDGSEIWVSFNPELDTDETYRRFVSNPPPGCEPIKVNWSDNPWFPEVLREEKDHLRETDPDAYLTVWEGHCRQVLDGAIYAKEIRQATQEGRITRVPYDRSKPVDCYFDLGRADKTVIWFAQQIGFEYHIVDYYENRGFGWDHYLKYISDTPYQIGTLWLPHDADHELLASRRTVAQQARDSGRVVRVLKRLPIAEGINAARMIFPNCWFDAEKCADGLNALRRYCYDVDQDTKQYSKNPLHDENSHGADGFRTLAMAIGDKAKPAPKAERTYEFTGLPSTSGWMS